MNMIIPLAELGHYLLFSILAGNAVLKFVPKTQKPNVHISKQVFLLCTLGIIVLTFLPVLQVIFHFKESAGFISAAISVLTSFRVGQGWLVLSLFSILLWITLYVDGSRYFQALWLLAMILAVSFSGHMSSISFWPGLLSHTVHFLMVTVWVGVLFHIAWFSKDQANWLRFLRWFTPLASVCFVLAFISGLIMMFFVVNPKEYANSWVFSYGQMLLLKHICIIPIVVFACINGILAKKALLHPSFNPRPWIKGESILLMLVFYFTGVLGTMPLPHEANSAKAPNWVEWLLSTKIAGPVQVNFAPSLIAMLFFLISFLFLLLIIFSFKAASPAFGIVMGCSFIIALYFGLMLSLSLHQKPEEKAALLPLEFNQHAINLKP